MENNIDKELSLIIDKIDLKELLMLYETFMCSWKNINKKSYKVRRLLLKHDIYTYEKWHYMTIDTLSHFYQIKSKYLLMLLLGKLKTAKSNSKHNNTAKHTIGKE